MHIEFYSTWMLVLMILRVMYSPTCLEKILIDACSSILKVMSSPTCLEKILIVGSIEMCVHSVAIETNFGLIGISWKSNKV
jgi:hypothetical protein